MSTHSKILLIEDDASLAEEVVKFLNERDFSVVHVSNIRSGRDALHDFAPDLCLIDIVLPGASGRVFCKEVVEQSDSAVVMISSLSDSETVIALLEMGADDYIVKPFNMGEMHARIRAVLRRRVKDRNKAIVGTKLGPWDFDTKERRLRHSTGFTVSLTTSEAEILRFMLASPGTVFTRDDLLAVSRMRQHAGPDDRAIDNLINRLRKKVEEDSKAPRHIITVWGKGYRLDV